MGTFFTKFAREHSCKSQTRKGPMLRIGGILKDVFHLTTEEKETLENIFRCVYKRTML